MINYLKNHWFTLIGILIICQFSFAQIENSKDPINLETTPIISGVHTLSVHVRDTISHDSVYQFFLHKLKLPIYYTPVKYGQTRYVGIYAGNMVLEPCGPYQNTVYATDSFRAIFYGMNFEVYKSFFIGLEAGYYYNFQDSNWSSGEDELESGPNVNSGGFYTRFIFGFKRRL